MGNKGRPRRGVVSKHLSHNPGNSGTKWVLKLECGHQAVRHRQAGRQNRNWKTYDAPKFVYCKRCQQQETQS